MSDDAGEQPPQPEKTEKKKPELSEAAKARKAHSGTLATPQLAKETWDAIEKEGIKPSLKKVAVKLKNAGTPVSENTLKKWKKQGWKRKGDPDRPDTPLASVAAEMDSVMPAMTGDSRDGINDILKKYGVSFAEIQAAEKAAREAKSSELAMLAVDAILRTAQHAAEVMRRLTAVMVVENPDGYARVIEVTGRLVAVGVECKNTAVSIAVRSQKDEAPALTDQSGASLAPPAAANGQAPTNGANGHAPVVEAEILPKLAPDDPLAPFFEDMKRALARDQRGDYDQDDDEE